eukprot:5390715-Pyramimonas_sp.AAC.1
MSASLPAPEKSSRKPGRPRRDSLHCWCSSASASSPCCAKASSSTRLYSSSMLVAQPLISLSLASARSSCRLALEATTP